MAKRELNKQELDDMHRATYDMLNKINNILLDINRIIFLRVLEEVPYQTGKEPLITLHEIAELYQAGQELLRILRDDMFNHKYGVKVLPTTRYKWLTECGFDFTTDAKLMHNMEIREHILIFNRALKLTSIVNEDFQDLIQTIFTDLKTTRKYFKNLTKKLEKECFGDDCEQIRERGSCNE